MITIKVCGPMRSGKTAFAELIYRTLKDRGLEVEALGERVVSGDIVHERILAGLSTIPVRIEQMQTPVERKGKLPRHNDIEEWTHRTEPLDDNFLAQVEEALDDPMGESRGHQKTIRVCRHMYDEIVRLKTIVKEQARPRHVKPLTEPGFFQSKVSNLVMVPRHKEELSLLCGGCGKRRGEHSALGHCPGNFPPGTRSGDEQLERKSRD